MEFLDIKSQFFNNSILVGGYHQAVPVPNYVSKGGPVPFYQEKIANGDFAETQMSGKKTVVNAVQYASFTRVAFGVTDTYVGLPFGLYISTDPDNDVLLKLQDEVTTKLYNQSRTTAKTLLGVTAAELHQTKAMVAKRGSEFLRSLDDFLGQAKRIQRRFRSKRQAAREINNLYLEYRYGWLGMLYDIKGLVEAFNQALEEPKFTKVKNSQTTDRTTYSRSDGVTWGTPSIREDTIHKRYQVRAYGVIKVTPDSGLMPSLGLEPENIVPTLWERIPFSFVIDYFGNLGEYLNASFSMYANLRWYTVIWAQETKTNIVFRSDPSQYHPGFEYYTNSGEFSATCNYFSRIPHEDLPVPKLVFKLPSSLVKWVNVLSLIGQKRL